MAVSQPNEKLQSELWSVAEKLADIAAPIGLQFFRSAGLDVENKQASDFDPVTEADRAIEMAIRDALAQLRPDDAVLGEEFGHRPGTTGLTWVIDPIDGTRAFIAGLPTWGTLIAVGPESGPTLGVVAQPHIGEVFIGGFGHAELRHGTACRQLTTRACKSLRDAVLFTTFPEIGTAQERDAFQRAAQEVRLTRYGTDCYAYALLAAGQVDLVIEAGLNAYDIQGPMALIQAAGGIVTNWTGGPAHNGGQVLAAGDAHVHAAAIKRLNGG